MTGLALTIAFASSSDTGPRGAESDRVDRAESAMIEFEGCQSEPSSGTELEEARSPQPTRRLRLRTIEHVTRVVCPPLPPELAYAPSTRALPLLVAEPCAGRDLLIRHRRFLI